MLLKLPSRPKSTDWNKWFAWYPVTIEVDLSGNSVLVWLQNVERRWVPASDNRYCYVDDGGYWEYLMPRGWKAKRR